MAERSFGEIDRDIELVEGMLADQDRIDRARFMGRLARGTGKFRQGMEAHIAELRGKNWFTRWLGDLKGEQRLRDNVATSEFVFNGLARILNDEVNKKGGVKDV